MDKKSKLGHFSETLVFVSSSIAFIALIIPVVGFSFSQGYLSIFGIGGGIFPIEIAELWSESYYVVLTFLVWVLSHYHWLIILAFAFFISTGTFVLFLLFFIGKDKLDNFFSKVENRKKEHDLLGRVFFLIHDVYENYLWMFNFLFYLGLVLVLSIFILMKPFLKGKEMAEGHFKEYKANACKKEKWSRCIIIRDLSNPGIELYKGFLVAGTNGHLAIFDGKETLVVPRLDNYEISVDYIESKDDGN